MSIFFMSIILYLSGHRFYIDDGPTAEPHECISNNFDFFSLLNLILVCWVVVFGRWMIRRNVHEPCCRNLNTWLNFLCTLGIFLLNFVMLNQLTGFFSGESKMHCQYLLYNIIFLWILANIAFYSGTVLCMYVNRALVSLAVRCCPDRMASWDTSRMTKQYHQDLVQLQMIRNDALRKTFKGDMKIVQIIQDYMDDLEKMVPEMKDYRAVERWFQEKENLLFGDLSPDMVDYRTESEESNRPNNSVIELQYYGEQTHARFSDDFGGFDEAAPAAAEPGASRVPPRYQDLAESNSNAFNSESWAEKLYNDVHLEQPPGYDDFIVGISNLSQEEGQSNWAHF